MANILVIEDEIRVATLIKRGLEESGQSVFTAFDIATAHRLLAEVSFDIIISDVILPDGNGFDLCQQIRKADPRIPILMLTALGTTDDKLVAFNAGADDYMVKPFDFRELEARIQVLLKRKSDMSKTTESDDLTYADIVINQLTKSVTRSGISISLTPKEYKLLLFFVQNPDRVISRSEIAMNVWDTHFDTGTNFIDVYINYLRKKMEKQFNSKLIHTKPGMGFIFTNKNENTD